MTDDEPHPFSCEGQLECDHTDTDPAGYCRDCAAYLPSRAATVVRGETGQEYHVTVDGVTVTLVPQLRDGPQQTRTVDITNLDQFQQVV